MPTFEARKPIAVTVDVLRGDVTAIAADPSDTVVEDVEASSASGSA